MFKRFIVLLLIVIVCDTVYAEQVSVATEQRTQYQRDRYLLELLQLALNNSAYQLQPTLIDQQQQRTIMKLADGDIDIHWGMTSPEREKMAIPVRIPLFKGLIGYRVALINKQNQVAFSKLSQQQLKQLVAVQGHDWPDTQIMAQNGYRVRPLANYETMFKVLEAGAVDYFPRSVIEVKDELAEYGKGELVIDEQHLFAYPTAFYFFVNSHKPALANALHDGLERLIQSGEFDAVFNRYFAQSLSELGLSSRTKHQMKNRFLPEETPLKRKELWF